MPGGRGPDVLQYDTPLLFMDFLEGLNSRQREAVTHREGPLLILAGAGSGKTRVITHRIAHLIRAQQVPAPGILAVTFTNKAAEEMRHRVAQLLGEPLSSGGPIVTTFHSFCVRLLRRDGKSLSDLRPAFTPQFTIYDEDDQLALVKSVYRQRGWDESQVQYRIALSRISHAKNLKQTPEDLEKAPDPKTKLIANVFRDYEARLREANALDFDDLLLQAVRLLEYNEQVREAYNHRFRFMMVDEYQDTNRSQYELMRLLTGRRSNIVVVGDEDQSIYSWRGADIRNILDFEKDFPDAKVIRLEQNYRSTRTILEAASAVVAHNRDRKGKWLWTEGGEGSPAVIYRAPDAENEALFIAHTIEKILRADPQDRVAVLYRTNAQSRRIEEALRRYGRKYVVVGGFSFYQRAEVKDILAYLKLVRSLDDSISLMRIINVPARGIGKTTLDQIERFAFAHHLSLWSALERLIDSGQLLARAEAALRAFRELIHRLRSLFHDLPLPRALRALMLETGYKAMLEADSTPQGEARRENLDELLSAAAEAAMRGETLADFLDHAALSSETDALDAGVAVSLLTAHNAKGLEFPIVFLAGLEEGLFPHSRSKNSEAMLEEERRLFYVGMTRAQKRLYMTWAKSRRRYGSDSDEATKRSRFLEEIPRELVEDFSEAEDASGLDLSAERHEVREAVRRHRYTGTAQNSLENISRFFEERGLPPLKTGPWAPGRAAASAPSRAPSEAAAAGTGSFGRPATGGGAAPARFRSRKLAGMRPGVTVAHPKYGSGLVLRMEGTGEEAKLTISFPGHGLKKIVAKYAEIKIEE